MIRKRLLIGLFLAVCMPIIFGHDLKGFDDTILFNLNWPGKSNDLIIEPGAEEPLIVTTHNKEKYKCFIPSLSETLTEPQALYNGPGTVTTHWKQNKNEYNFLTNSRHSVQFQVQLISYPRCSVHRHVHTESRVIGHTRYAMEITSNNSMRNVKAKPLSDKNTFSVNGIN